MWHGCQKVSRSQRSCLLGRLQREEKIVFVIFLYFLFSACFRGAFAPSKIPPFSLFFFSIFYAHDFVSGKCHVVHSPKVRSVCGNVNVIKTTTKRGGEGTACDIFFFCLLVSFVRLVLFEFFSFPFKNNFYHCYFVGFLLPPLPSKQKNQNILSNPPASFPNHPPSPLMFYISFLLFFLTFGEKCSHPTQTFFFCSQAS